MKLYVYCFAEKIDALATSLAPVSGISGAAVELIRIDDFSVLVSDFQGDAVPVNRDNALAHAAAVGSLLNETTPLPLRFGTVVGEQHLRSYLATHREALKAKLDQVRGCVEMSVKIIWNTDLEEQPAPDKDVGPGAAFLRAKRREILGGERRAEQARQVASWLQEQVRPLVRLDEVSLCPTEKLIVAAAHLVPREEVASYRERLTESRKMRPELHFLVSGPWAPYSFSNIELEFKTRFGVS